MSVSEEIKEGLGSSQEYVALTTVHAGKYQETNLEIIKFLIQENTPGVYVTLNKPFETLRGLFKKENISEDMVIFIDAVTQTSGGKVEKTKNCLFIGNPENLSDLSFAMDQAVRAVPGTERFLFFDSLNTLLLYNDTRTVAQFIHFLAGKMRVWKVKGIIISLEKESDKELIDELGQFCDVRLDL